MRRVYDNWERLVEATLNREELRRLALCPSIDTASGSSISAPSNTFLASLQGCSFARSSQLAYSVITAADVAVLFRQECLELKSTAQKLAGLLHQAARASHHLYDRPARHIVSYMEDVLEKALALLLKCHGRKRLFNHIDPTAIRTLSLQLSNSIRNVSWLVHGDEYLLLPPIAADKPFLYRVWEPIATLYMGSEDEQCDATASLVSWARNDDLYKKLIVEEGGLEPLLRIVKEGKLEAQENAVKVIGMLGNDVGNAAHLIDAGVCPILATILEEGPMELQPLVASALSELTSNSNIFEHHFRPQDIVGLLATHLGGKKTISSRDYTKEMAAAALWHLVKVDSNIYNSITKSSTLLCFAVPLERGPKAAQYYCALTLMEVTAAAERDADLRARSGFKLNTHACSAVLDQLCRIIDETATLELLLPCIRIVGNLATTIRASETRMIKPLVSLLDKQHEGAVTREACVALTKYACPDNDNFLALDRSKAIVSAGGVKHLVVLVYFGEQIVRIPALILLCYIARNMPHSEHFSDADVTAVLGSASRQPLLVRDKDVKKLLMETKSTLERCHSRTSKEHH